MEKSVQLMLINTLYNNNTYGNYINSENISLLKISIIKNNITFKKIQSHILEKQIRIIDKII